MRFSTSFCWPLGCRRLAFVNAIQYHDSYIVSSRDIHVCLFSHSAHEGWRVVGHRYASAAAREARARGKTHQRPLPTLLPALAALHTASTSPLLSAPSAPSLPQFPHARRAEDVAARGEAGQRR